MPVQIPRRDILFGNRDQIRIPQLGEGGPQVVLNPELQMVLDRLASQLSVLSSTVVIRRGFGQRSVSIGTTPTKVVYATGTKAFLFLNPASSVTSGITISGALIGSAAMPATITADGNTQATALGVANYRDCHLHLQVSNIVGVPQIDFYVQSQNPISTGWADAQLVFPSANPIVAGEYYANLESLSVAGNLAIRYDYTGNPAADSADIRLAYTLKNGLPGTSTGTSRTIYLGNAGVTATSGYPLLEGQTLPAYLTENTELWAVANANVTLNVFELQ